MIIGRFRLVLGGWILLTMIFASGDFVSAQGGSYKIGVNLELTGPWANITGALKMALQMETDRVNANGGINGRRLELLIADNGFDQAKAAVNMLRFARDPEVLAVVGPFEDNFQATTRAIAEREKITNIIVCPSNPELRALNQKWSFNIAHNGRVVTRKLIDLCLARKYKTVLVLAGNWPLAQSLARNFEAAASQNGIEALISPETHQPTDIDMSPQLIKLLPTLSEKSVDAIYLATGGPPGPILCKNIKTLGIRLPIIGTHAFGFRFILDIGGDAVEGVEFATGKPVVPYQLDPNDPVKNVITAFDQRMKSRYGIPADQVSGHGYDIVWLIHDALMRINGKADRRSFRQSLERTEGFKGCTGVYTFSPTDHDGLSKSDLVFVRIRNGGFERIRLPGFEAR